jgi:hypothetical protein
MPHSSAQGSGLAGADRVWPHPLPDANPSEDPLVVTLLKPPPARLDR